MKQPDNHTELVKTARITGFWYLMLAVSGVLGFLVYHSQIFIAGDASTTLENLQTLESTARVRLLLEFMIVISQAFTAVYFYRLFKSVNAWAAWALAAWGTVNAIAITISAIAMASAISIANSAASAADQLLAVQFFQAIISHAWTVGGIFFGLWLLPMGYIVIKSGRMPVWMGRIIVLGGIGYVVSTFIAYSGLDFAYNELLPMPATVGEFWIIGYLLIFGIRPEAK